jgi:hypothetical protein
VQLLNKAGERYFLIKCERDSAGQSCQIGRNFASWENFHYVKLSQTDENMVLNFGSVVRNLLLFFLIYFHP